MPSIAEPEVYMEQERCAALHPLAGGVAAVVSVRSPAKETGNEDGAALIPAGPGRAVIAVADGLGGHADGATAAALAVRALVRAVSNAGASGEALQPAILRGFDDANDRVVALGTGAATTLAAVAIEGRTMRTYHAGDTAILLAGQRGKVRFQSVSHSPVGYAVESGLLDHVEAIRHESRHIVSNIVGSPEMRIDIGPVLELRPRDTLILATDGLFDNLYVAEIVDLARTGSLGAVAARLAAAALARMTGSGEAFPGKPDDLTAVVFRLEGARGGRMRFPEGAK